MVRSTYGRFVPLGQRMFKFFSCRLAPLSEGTIKDYNCYY